MARNKDEMADEVSGEEAVSRVYELGFHLDPELPTEEVKNAYQAMRAVVENHAALVAEGEPQQVRLAYTISRQETTGRRDFDTAYFSWIAYETSPEGHEAVLAAAKSESRIVRFIDLVTTKETAHHAVELRELAMKTEGGEEAEAEDAALDAALESAGA